MVPILSESQQIIRALLRRHGDLTVEEVAAVSGLDVERDLQELERKGCVESAGGDRWRLCDTWASRIVITEGLDYRSVDWAKQKTRERRYFAEREQRANKLREFEVWCRAEKVSIMKLAGLACSEKEPDFYMFHNPFVWMHSERHSRWAGVDYSIAVRILDLENQVRAAVAALDKWCVENDTWPPIFQGRKHVSD